MTTRILVPIFRWLYAAAVKAPELVDAAEFWCHRHGLIRARSVWSDDVGDITVYHVGRSELE